MGINVLRRLLTEWVYPVRRRIDIGLMTVEHAVAWAAHYPLEPRYTRWGFYPQVAIIFASWCWFQFNPLIPTVAIGILGVVAAIMAARAAHITEREGAIWALIAFALFIVEMRAVYRDRSEHDIEQSRIQAEEREARKKEKEAFDALIMDGKSLWSRTGVIGATITGGEGYCLLDVYLRSDGTLYGKGESNAQFGLNYVNATITHNHKSISFYLGDKLRPNAEFPIPPKVLSYFHGDNSKEQTYDVVFQAMNGFWTERIRFVRVKGHWVRAFRVGASLINDWNNIPPGRLRADSFDPGFPMLNGNMADLGH
jgi:hypothetical protein